MGKWPVAGTRPVVCLEFLAAVVALSSSCVHETQTAMSGPRRTAVSTVMTRHIANAVDAGDGDLEIRNLRRRLAADPHDLDARILLARQYTKHGLPDLALEHYRMAAALFPDAYLVALEESKTLRQIGEGGEALKTIDGFLSKHPNANWELLSFKGVLEDERGEAGEAEAAYRAGIALEPASSALHNNLGYNLLSQGHPEQAASEFQRAIEIDPHSAIAHNNLAAVLAAQSRPDSGAAHEKALHEWERSGDAASAHNNLAAVLIEQGRYPEARTELEAALKIRRDFPAALSNLELVAERDGNPATLPVPVNFWKRIAYTLGYFVTGESQPKPPATSVEGTPSGAAPAPGKTEISGSK